MNVYEAIRTRRSVRRYSPQPIPEDTLSRLRDALRLAPSACNFQPWRFIFVTDQRLRTEFGQVAHQQTFIAQAPVIVVGCGFPDRAYKGMGGRGNSVDIDVAIALDHLTLAAVAEGLGTCWIGAFDEQAVKRLLEIPQEVKVVALTPLGFPESSDLIRPVVQNERKTERDVFSVNRFAPR